MSTVLTHTADPEILQVQWLENGLLLHALTLNAPPIQPYTNVLLGISVGATLLGIAALATSWWWLAFGMLLLWSLSAVALSRAAWQVWHMPPSMPPPRRLLIELSPTEIAWSLLVSNRFSMHHDRQLGIALVEHAAPASTPSGSVVRVTLRDGEPQEIPLYGLPWGDAQWLAQRINEAVEAACDTDIEQ